MSDEKYTQKCETSTLSATSRASVKVGDSFYTLEYSEERTVPQRSGVDLDKEKELLWEEVNYQVDKQIEDVLKTFNNR